jgi:hypothetical protein
MTQQVIDKLLASPQCMASVKSVPCDDYQARFGAFIRVKHGHIVLNLVDWDKVAQTITSTL